jgi:multisubunit Na+/H+ antiporter MnhE subunit
VRRLLRIVVLTALWFGAWLLLTATLAPAELVVGAICALVSGAASEVAWGAHLTAFGADRRLLPAVLRLPPLLVTDSARIFAVLFLHLFTRRKAGSCLRVVAFDPGDPDDPKAAARRALAIGLFTMTPNSIAIGIDHDKRQLLYHQLAATDVPRLLRDLGAAP